MMFGVVAAVSGIRTKGVHSIMNENGILWRIMHNSEELPRYQSADERTLLKGVQDLAPQALSEVHQRYFPLVFRYVRYRTGDAALSEDIASDVFLRLLEACVRHKGPDKNLRSWLIATASNIVSDHYRKQYKSPRQDELFDMPDGNPVPEEHLELKERNKRIRQAMRQLTAEQQQVLALRFGERLSVREVSEIMGKKPNAIKQMQYRALVSLRRNLEKMGK